MEQLEIERKFVLKELPETILAGVCGQCIRQGYLLSGDSELRIRERGGKCTMTVKRGTGLKRQEQECVISAQQFDMLWPLTEGQRIDKVRYVVPCVGLNYEIDVFKGDLAPLKILEIEFDSVAASREFNVPDFVAREVTEDKAYKNAALALMGLPVGSLLNG